MCFALHRFNWSVLLWAPLSSASSLWFIPHLVCLPSLMGSFRVDLCVPWLTSQRDPSWSGLRWWWGQRAPRCRRWWCPAGRRTASAPPCRWWSRTTPARLDQKHKKHVTNWTEIDILKEVIFYFEDATFIRHAFRSTCYEYWMNNFTFPLDLLVELQTGQTDIFHFKHNTLELSHLLFWPHTVSPHNRKSVFLATC